IESDGTTAKRDPIFQGLEHFRERRHLLSGNGPAYFWFGAAIESFDLAKSQIPKVNLFFQLLPFGVQTVGPQKSIMSNDHLIVVTELKIQLNPIPAHLRPALKSRNHILGPLIAPAMSMNLEVVENFAFLASGQGRGRRSPKGLPRFHRRASEDKREDHQNKGFERCHSGVPFRDPPSSGGSNGSLTASLPELPQVHKNIDLSEVRNQGISHKCIELYSKGYSLSEVSNLTGKARSTIQSILGKAGIALRPNRSVPGSLTWKNNGKNCVPPPYGFCYFQGKVVPDQKEYGNLLIIHRLWKERVNPNAIANQLNTKKIKPRKASAWNRNSVVKILRNFETKAILIKGDQYELR
ncbi:MAG TPA: hypothetical protein PL182_00460, partial [Pseudobdellovibrionaceae bacterium]|nr:hypothetical protein [Pseudobdellovibrionaceae bacterium]